MWVIRTSNDVNRGNRQNLHPADPELLTSCERLRENLVKASKNDFYDNRNIQLAFLGLLKDKMLRSTAITAVNHTAWALRTPTL